MLTDRNEVSGINLKQCKVCPDAILSTSNPTWKGLEYLRFVLGRGKQGTKDTSNGSARTVAERFLFLTGVFLIFVLST